MQHIDQPGDEQVVPHRTTAENEDVAALARETMRVVALQVPQRQWRGILSLVEIL